MIDKNKDRQTHINDKSLNLHKGMFSPSADLGLLGIETISDPLCTDLYNQPITYLLVCTAETSALAVLSP